MQILGRVRYRSSTNKVVQTRFGGYDHRKSADDGAIYDELNMTSDYYPLLAPRKPRVSQTATSVTGALGGDELVWVDNGKVYRSGRSAALMSGLTSSEKIMVRMGYRVLIWPDKVYVNLYDNSSGTLGATSGTAASATIGDGSLYDEDAESNSLTITGKDWAALGFKVGDGVTITGCSVRTANNKTPIIREISGATLRFSELAFFVGDDYADKVDIATHTITAVGESSFDYKAGDKLRISKSASNNGIVTVTAATDTVLTVSETLTAETGVKVIIHNTEYTESAVQIERVVPDLDDACVHDNRIFGIKGDSIIASKQGDPFNWYCFDGISTDSWEGQTGTPGGFTAIVSFRGYPTAFKADKIFKVYGTQPAYYQLIDSAVTGVQEGCRKSVAVAHETLYYKSVMGIMSYSGGYPNLISENFGPEVYSDVVGGSDGVKYYCSMLDASNNRVLMVYDPQHYIWTKESDPGISFIVGVDGNILYLTDDAIYGMGSTPEGDVNSEIVFAPCYDDVPDRKKSKKIQLRIEAEQGAYLILWASYDGGEYLPIREFEALSEIRTSYYLAAYINRCDRYQLKITGTGKYWIYSLARTVGSASGKGEQNDEL